MDLAQEFLDSYIDYEKREYLRNGKDFMPTFIAFEGEKAWVIPFCTPDREAKDRRLKVLAAAFEAKGIRRYGYIMDVWCAELDPAKFGHDPKTVTREEMEQVRSQYLPEDLANYVERKETLILFTAFEGRLTQLPTPPDQTLIYRFSELQTSRKKGQEEKSPRPLRAMNLEAGDRPLKFEVRRVEDRRLRASEA